MNFQSEHLGHSTIELAHSKLESSELRITHLRSRRTQIVTLRVYGECKSRRSLGTPSVFYSMRKKEVAVPAAPPAPTTEEKLLMEIRDLLKK